MFLKAFPSWDSWRKHTRVGSLKEIPELINEYPAAQEPCPKGERSNSNTSRSLSLFLSLSLSLSLFLSLSLSNSDTSRSLYLSLFLLLSVCLSVSLSLFLLLSLSLSLSHSPNNLQCAKYVIIAFLAGNKVRWLTASTCLHPLLYEAIYWVLSAYRIVRNFGGQKIWRIGQKLILAIKMLANEQPSGWTWPH